MNPASLPCESRPRGPRRTRGARDAITVRRLEVLLRLHRRDLDGAGAELLDALDTRRDELAGCLGISCSDLPLPGGPEQLPRLVALVETRLRELRDDHAVSRATEAHRLAARLAEESVYGLDGWELDQPCLDALVAVSGFDLVGFRIDDEVLAVGRCFAAALLREVGNVTLTVLHLAPSERALHVAYRGSIATGRFRLRLEPPRPDRICVVVDLDAIRTHAPSADQVPNARPNVLAEVGICPDDAIAPKGTA